MTKASQVLQQQQDLGFKAIPVRSVAEAFEHEARQKRGQAWGRQYVLPITARNARGMSKRLPVGSVVILRPGRPCFPELGAYRKGRRAFLCRIHAKSELTGAKTWRITFDDRPPLTIPIPPIGSVSTIDPGDRVTLMVEKVVRPRRHN